MESTIRCPRCDQEIDATEPGCPACGSILSGTMQCARHADVQAIGTCVFCGDPVCDECNIQELSVHFACPEHQSVPLVEGWAQIYSTFDEFEAQLIKDNFEAEGIDCEVLSQKDTTFTVDFGDLSPIRILVPAYSYLDAVPILADHMDEDGEVEFGEGDEAEEEPLA
jgi:hypothetical protein